MKKFFVIFLILAICIQGFSICVFAADEPVDEPINYPRERLAIYYSWPSAVNGANGDVDVATEEFARYDIIVFPGSIENPSHGDHDKASQIITNLNGLGKKVFGYVDLGMTNLPIDTISTHVDLWKSMGAYGIFLDTAGYDYGVTRERQNTVVDYIHSQDMQVFMNAWNPDDVCGDLDENGNVNATHLAEGDWYLAESWMVSNGNYFVYFKSDDGSVYNCFDKADKCLNYRRTKGIQTAVVATNFAPQPSDYMSDKYKMAWWSAAMYDFPFQWTDINYSSLTSTMYDYPEIIKDFGSVFTADPVRDDSDENGIPVNITRTTDKGTIYVELDSDNEGHVTGSTGYMSPPVIVDGISSEWDCIPSLSSGAATMKVTNDLDNLYLIIQGSGLAASDQLYFDIDNDVSTGLTSWAVKGVDYLLQSSMIYAYTGDGSSWAWDIDNPIQLSPSQFIVSDDGGVIEVSIPLELFGLSKGSVSGIGFIKGDGTEVRIPVEGNILPTVRINAFPTASTNAELVSLQLNPGVLVFDSNKKEYAVTVPYTASETAASALVSDAQAVLVINGETIAYDCTKIVLLVYGNNEIQISITAADEITTNEYLINVYRETESETLANYPVITVDGNVSDWSSICPLATGTSIIRSVKVTNDKNNLFLLAEGDKLDVNTHAATFYIDADNNTSTGFSKWGDSGAEYMIQNGWLYKYNGDGNDWAWEFLGTLPTSQYTSNASAVEASVLMSDLGISKGDRIGAGFVSYDASWAVNDLLPETASEFTTKKLVSEASSSNAYLQDLTVSQGSISFQADTMEYTITVPSTENSLDVTAHTADANAYLQINGEKVYSGVAQNVELGADVNTISIMVTAENDITTCEYKIKVEYGKEANPKTGDNGLSIYLLIATIAFFVVAVLYFTMFKKKVVSTK